MSQLGTLLADPGPEHPFASGRIELILDHHDPSTATFPVRAADEEPTLPDLVRVHDDWVCEHPHNEMLFVVHLRLDTAPVARVHLEKRAGRLFVAVDPGPLPHQQPSLPPRETREGGRVYHHTWEDLPAP